MTIIELRGCIAGQWTPQIGDPDMTGWLTVLSYGATACLALTVWCGLKGRRGRVFWGVLVVLLAFLAVNKQLDLQTAMTAAGKCLARAQGWYDNRRVVQAVFIAALLATVCVSLSAAIRALRGRLSRNLLAVGGLAVLLAFVMVRAVSFHHFDILIGGTSLGVSNNFLFENAGLLLIAVNAVLLLRRPAARLA